jgi:hypothetical protein
LPGKETHAFQASSFATRQISSASGHDSDDLHAIPLGKRSRRPFVPAQGCSVVLHEHCGRGQAELDY